MDVKTLPTHPFTGLTAIGFTSRGPVWPVVGGSQPAGEETDDADDDTEDGDETEDGAEEPEEPEVDWQSKATELQAQLEASQANLTRARSQAKRLREQAKTSTPAAPAPAKAAPAKTTPARQQPAEPQVVTVQDDAEVERLQTVALRAYAKAALLGAGCDPDLIDAPLSRLKAGEVDWPEDEDEPFLDEWIEDMKQRYGKAFAKPEPAPAPRVGGVRRAAGIDQAAGNGATGRRVEEQKSFGQTLWESGQGDIRAPRRGR